MARRSNPYYTAPSGGYAPIGQGISNLASAFTNTPNAADTAKAEALAWQARGSRQEQEMNRQNLAERDRLANLFEMYDPETYDPRQVMATAVRGGQGGSDIADLFLTAAGNLDGMTDDQRAGALVGTGRMLGENDAVSMDHQAQLRSENQAADLTGLSRDSVVARAFLEGGPEAGREALGSLYHSPREQQSDPWLQATRKAKLEEEISGEIGALSADLGLPEGTPVPPELRGYILPRAMALVSGPEGMTPRTAVARVLQDVGPRAEGTGWFDGDPRVGFDIPADRQQPARGPQSMQLPPVGERVNGRVYDTPRGPMQWVADPATGETGWRPAQG